MASLSPAMTHDPTASAIALVVRENGDLETLAVREIVLVRTILRTSHPVRQMIHARHAPWLPTRTRRFRRGVDAVQPESAQSRADTSYVMRQVGMSYSVERDAPRSRIVKPGGLRSGRSSVDLPGSSDQSR